ncbi:MAG TPA: LysR substrate-binding domain-containing protein [Kiloniellaceae bacterium]|nr:LysR substrate-binding domain-containing protein [Kiloniellaceae bacterium]
MRQLEVFNALMEAGSVSRAALRLNLTQPAVSIALSGLEEELGFRLFHRSKGYFAPTGEALLLHDEAEQTLMAVERVAERALEIRAGAVGGVSIASNGAAAINLLPWVFAEFQRDHPGVKLDLKVRSSPQIANWVRGRQVDIGLVDAPVPGPGLDVETFQLPCVCILRADDPLATHARLTPKLVAGRNMIAITGNHDIDRQLDHSLTKAGVTAQRTLSCSYFAIARNLVRAGAGLALVDVVNGSAPLDDGVCWRPFSPGITFDLALLRAPSPPLQRSAESFYGLLRARLLPLTRPLSEQGIESDENQKAKGDATVELLARLPKQPAAQPGRKHEEG